MASGTTGTGGGAVHKAARGVVHMSEGSMIHRPEVKSVVWRAGTSPNQAEVAFPRARLQGIREELGAVPNNALRISVDLPGGGSRTIFAGRWAKRTAQYNERTEEVTAVAYGARWDLDKDYILGQLVSVVKNDGSGDTRNEVVTARPCVFNDNSRGNKDVAQEGTEGPVISVFHTDPRVFPAEEFEWTLGEALIYCYGQRERDKRWEFRTPGSSSSAGTNLVGDPLGKPGAFSFPDHDLVLYGIDVDGHTIKEAFDALISAAGLLWWCRPLGLQAGSPRHELKVHRRRLDTESRPTIHKLFMPFVPSGDYMPVTHGSAGLSNPALPADRPDHNRLVYQEDHSAVLSEMLAVGAPILLQAEFVLKQGWRPSDELDIVGDTTDPTTDIEPDDTTRIDEIRRKLAEVSSGKWPPDLGNDPSVARHKDVGRLFILDETGYETSAGDPYDWVEYDSDPAEPVFDSSVYKWFAIAPRPFRRFLDSQIKMDGSDNPLAEKHAFDQIKPHKLEIKNPISGEFEGVDFAWEFDTQRAGIRITEPTITRSPLFDLRTRAFAERVRIKASIEWDYRIFAGEIDTPEDYWPDSKVEARSVVKAIREYQRGGRPQTQLVKLAESRLRANIMPLVTATFVVPSITMLYEPGHWITKVQGRGFDLIGQIEEVRFDFDNQETHVTLDQPLLVLPE